MDKCGFSLKTKTRSFLANQEIAFYKCYSAFSLRFSFNKVDIKQKTHGERGGNQPKSKIVIYSKLTNNLVKILGNYSASRTQ